MIISGKDLALRIKHDIAEKVKECEKKYGRVPHQVVILVGEDPASMSYVKSKGKDAEQVGFKGPTIRLPESTSEQELLDLIASLNADEGVDGILVQLPVPEHIDESKVIAAISHEKDVDGFHPLNVAALWQKNPCVNPCTPKGVIKMLEEAGVEIEGKRAVVIGRSNIVGLPMAKMLLDRNATVTVAHSRTRDRSGRHPGGRRRTAPFHHRGDGGSRRGGHRRGCEPRPGDRQTRWRRRLRACGA